MRPVLLIWLFGVFMAVCHGASAARDYIEIVGSSTVYPFATVVAERFGRATKYKTPKIETTGSGGGLKLFCQGLGLARPDIANASRRITESEVANCRDNGVEDIVEVLIGFDGIIIGHNRHSAPMQLSRRELFMALAEQVPDPGNESILISNPYQLWSQINPALPADPIRLLGPPPTSGTRDALVELIMEPGCKTFDSVRRLAKQQPDQFKQVCHRVREDGAYVEAGENDNLILQKLNADPTALGVFGYSFLDQNRDVIKAVPIDGQEPSFEAIATGIYPVSRPLYFYLKKAHVGVIPGLREYVLEFTSEKAWGDEGYLAEKGMIPLSADRRQQVAADILNLQRLQLSDLK